MGPSAGATWTHLWVPPSDRVARFSLLTIVNAGASQLIYIGLGTAAAVGAAVWQETVPGGTSVARLEGMCLDDTDHVWCYGATHASFSVAGFGSLLLGDPS